MRENSGELVESFLLEVLPADILDDHGQESQDWEKHGRLRAKRRMLGGRILEAARQLYEKTTHEMICRYHTKLAEPNLKKRLVASNGRIFDVGYVDDMTRRHDLRVFVSDTGKQWDG